MTLKSHSISHPAKTPLRWQLASDVRNEYHFASNNEVVRKPSLLIKAFPPELHRKLKDEAAHHHRSMIRQALALL
jgi:hypothetical protein